MGSDTLTKLARPRNVIKAAEVKLIWKYRVNRAVGLDRRTLRFKLTGLSVNQFHVMVCLARRHPSVQGVIETYT